MAVIEFDGITKRFGKLVAVDHLSFEVEAGQVVGFLGRTGPARRRPCGCCSALSARAKERPPSMAGRTGSWPNPFTSSAPYWKPLTSTPAARLATPYGPRPCWAGSTRRRVGSVLELVDLAGAAHRRVGEFSLGMRQRLGLAVALLCDPEVLVLDEPANGLDPEGVHWLRQLLRRLAGEGRTVLVSSHLLAEVAQTVDRVVILDHGRLAANTTLGELMARADGRGSPHTLEDVFLQLTSSSRSGEVAR